MRTFLALALSLAFSASAFAVPVGKKPDNHGTKVACNKYWHVYMKEHNLKGYDRKKYMSDCLSGKIVPPVVVPDEKPDHVRAR